MKQVFCNFIFKYLLQSGENLVAYGGRILQTEMLVEYKLKEKCIQLFLSVQVFLRQQTI